MVALHVANRLFIRKDAEIISGRQFRSYLMLLTWCRAGSKQWRREQ